jgi:hypothetical protein
MVALVTALLMVVAPKTGPAMCALGPGDFQSAGVANAAKPNVNVQDGGASVYCVYAGKSSATGGIELDVFYPAGANAAEVKATYETAIGEGTNGLQPLKLAGADEARWSANAVSGGPPYASIAVRRKSLVFVLGLPTSKNAEVQLTKLASLLLKRL